MSSIKILGCSANKIYESNNKRTYLISTSDYMSSIYNLTWNWETLREWIPAVEFFTHAYSCMANDTANSVCTAGACTWIFAFLIYASESSGTFAINKAFRSTIWWYTNITQFARTERRIFHILTQSIGTTRRRLTWIYW